MLITKVELRNIKNHAEADFTFQPGVIAICGPNGAGKTTILEAIAWALFDHLDYKRDDFVKRGAKRGQVSVAFRSNLDDREYIVTRDTGGGYFVYDPIAKIKLIEQKGQVVPWLERHIGVEPGTDLAVLFKTTIGVPQGTFTYDFTLSPSNRKTVFDQILKVEEYRRASDNLRETLRHIETRITEADRKLAEAEGELKACDETKREHDEVDGSLQSLEKELAAASEGRDRAAREVESLDQLLTRLEAQRGAVERLQVKLEFTRDSLAVAREAAEAARAAARIVESAREGHGKYLTASARLSELERQRVARDELRGRIATIEREWIETRSQARLTEERLKEIASARDELSQLAEKITEQQAIEGRIAALREERGGLQSLKRSTAALDRELERLRERYAAMQKQIEMADARREIAARAESLDEERAGLDAEIHQKELALGRAKLRLEQIASLQTDCIRLTEETDRCNAEIARLQPFAAQAVRLVEIETGQQSRAAMLAQLRAEVARDEEMIRALDQGGVCPLLTERCLNLKAGESLDGRFRAGLTVRREEIAGLEQGLATIAGDLQQSRAAAAEIARLPHLQTELSRLAQELDAKRRQVVEFERNGQLVSDAEVAGLRQRRAAIEQQLREAHEARMALAQADSLRPELEDIRKEGETKRQERDAIEQRASRIGEVEASIAAAEQALRALDDPRGRAASLQRLIGRESELRLQAERVARLADQINAQLEAARSELESFAALDVEIAAANQTRAECERDYHAFIQNEKIAATASAREQEAAQIAVEIDQTETRLAAARDELRDLEAQYDPQRHRSAQ